MAALVTAVHLRNAVAGLRELGRAGYRPVAARPLAADQHVLSPAEGAPAEPTEPELRSARRAPTGPPAAIDALVLDAAQRQSLVTLRELGRAGLRVHVADMNRHAPAFASRWSDGHHLLPDFGEHPDEYMQAVLRLCEELAPAVVIPSRDGTIEVLRANREAMESRCRLALASEPGLGAAVDKSLTLACALDVGLRVPRGALVRQADEAEAAVGEVGLPAVIKPVRSYGWTRGPQAYGVRMGAVAVESATEARHVVATMISFAGGALVQEWLPGDREKLSFFYADGRVWARFAQRVDRAWPAVGGTAVMRESIPLPPDIAHRAEQLVIALGVDGCSEVEFRRDAAGRAALMEINPRLPAGIEIAVRSGVPFPRMMYDWASGGDLQMCDGYRLGVRMRWLGGDLLWLRSAMTHPGRTDVPTRGWALGQFLTDFARPIGYDYLALDDMRPAFSAAGGAVSRAPGLAQRARRGRGARSGR